MPFPTKRLKTLQTKYKGLSWNYATESPKVEIFSHLVPESETIPSGYVSKIEEKKKRKSQFLSLANWTQFELQNEQWQKEDCQSLERIGNCVVEIKCLSWKHNAKQDIYMVSIVPPQKIYIYTLKYLPIIHSLSSLFFLEKKNPGKQQHNLNLIKASIHSNGQIEIAHPNKMQ